MVHIATFRKNGGKTMKLRILACYIAASFLLIASQAELSTDALSANKQGGGRFTTTSKTKQKPKKTTSQQKRPVANNATSVQSRGFIGGNATVNCSFRWTARGYGAARQADATLTANAGKVCRGRFIGRVSSHGIFHGADIVSSGQNIRVIKTGKNQFIVRPRTGFSGKDKAKIIIRMTKLGDRADIQLNTTVIVK